jgi:hypothetical protein
LVLASFIVFAAGFEVNVDVDVDENGEVWDGFLLGRADELGTEAAGAVVVFIALCISDTAS